MSDGVDRAAMLGRPGRRYPELLQLFGGYLHRDWTLLYDSWEEAVDAFATEVPADQREQASAELEALITSGLDEAGLSAVLRDLDCNLDREGRGLTTRRWLEMVAERLRRP